MSTTKKIVPGTNHNGEPIEYLVLNDGRNGDMYFHKDTAIPVAELLYHNCTSTTSERLALDLGDTDTGESWGEVYEIMGHVGRSTGQVKVPLLIHNAWNTGGGVILTHCIVGIYTAKGKHVLWKHPKSAIRTKWD